MVLFLLDKSDLYGYQLTTLIKKLSGGNGSETISFKVEFADEKGNILVEIDEYTTKLGNLNKFNGSTAIDNAHSKFNDIKNFNGGSETFKNAVSNLNSIVSFKMPSALSEARSLMEEANAWTAKKF